jgi:hypothetical protein
MPELLPPGYREGVRWYPRSVIEKYSADQVAWARRRSWDSFRRVPLTGEYLRAAFRVPEDGLVYDSGNGVTAGGLVNLARVLAAAGGHPLAPGHAAFGVGTDGETPFDREQVQLANTSGESPEVSWYQPMDAGYPRPGAGASIEGQATFTEQAACFAWHEWCWAAGPVRPVPHHSLQHVYDGAMPAMVNRKASPVGFGLKEPGVAWCFRTQVELLG